MQLIQKIRYLDQRPVQKEKIIKPKELLSSIWCCSGQGLIRYNKILNLENKNDEQIDYCMNNTLKFEGK